MKTGGVACWIPDVVRKLSPRVVLASNRGLTTKRVEMVTQYKLLMSSRMQVSMTSNITDQSTAVHQVFGNPLSEFVPDSLWDVTQ